MSEPEPPPESIEPSEESEEQLERRYPSTIGGAFYIGILIATAFGIGIVYRSHDWRLGVRVVAGALLAAALLRLILPQRDAGMLAVRSRMVDVGLLVVVGGALFFLSGSIPDQPL